MGTVARLLIGFAVAAVCTPAGVSGAFLLLPIQVQVLHVPSPAVTATNLLYNVTSTPAGVATYHRLGRLDRRLAGLLCLGTAPGVVAGVVLRSTWLADADRFGWVAATVLVGLGGWLLLEPWRPGAAASPLDRTVPALRLGLIGAVAGSVGGIYGLGGAALIVPWLVAVERLPLERVAGAGLVATLVTSIVGLAAFAAADLADVGRAATPSWADGLALGLGGAAGAVVGARLQPHVPVRLLRTVLALAAVVAGLRAIP